jgi:hypothetical protein
VVEFQPYFWKHHCRQPPLNRTPVANPIPEMIAEPIARRMGAVLHSKSAKAGNAFVIRVCL